MTAWVKQANGLWHSYDPVIRKQRLRKAGKDRVAGIRVRLDALMTREGFRRNERNRWERA